MKLFKRTILTLTIISVISILMIKSSYANDLIDQIISLFSSNEVTTSTSEAQNTSNDPVDVIETPSMPDYFEGDISFANSTEVIDRRTINSKTYKNQNGTYTTLIDISPIHYKDSTNKWKDIDTNLISSDEESVDKETTKGLAKVQFLNQAESDIVSIQRKNRRIIFKPLGFGNNNNTPANKNSKAFLKNKAKYQNIYPDIDILYTVLNDGVKEDIVLKNYSGANIFNFQVKASGLTAQKNDDGTISFIDKDTDETIFYLPKPISYDSGAEQSYGKTEYVLENLGTNNYLIKIVVDENWLTDPKTVYPVTIDPTTKYFQEGNSITNTGRDAKIYRYYPDDNYATTNLSVGENSLGYQWRSLIQINPESGAVPSNANIIDATWSVYMYAQSDGNGVYITWSRINSTWYESTVTWNNQPSYVSSGLPQGWTSNTFGWKNWDVTNLYSGWHDGSITNRGLMMWVNDHDYYKWKAFYSNEYSTQSQRPRLAVTYSLKPSATVVSPKNDVFINDTTPTFDWDYSDSDGDSQTKYQVQVSTNSSFSSTVLDSGTISSANTYWTPSTQLSSNTKYYWRVRVYDSYDWSNYSTTASFRLDTNLPTNGTIKINSDAYNTNTLDVTLTHLSATDSYSGVSKMRFSDTSTFTSSWQPYTTSFNYDLPPGDGNKTVYAQYQDNAGNQTTVPGVISDSIIYDSNNLGEERGISNELVSILAPAKVNLSSGNLYMTTQDLYVKSLSPALKIERTYNHQSTDTSAFGTSWMLAIPQIMVQTDGNLIYTDETGARHLYKKNGSSYIMPPGQNIDIVDITGGYKATTINRDSQEFDLTGKITKTYDSNNNTTYYTYDQNNNLIKLNDDANQEINLTYSSNLITSVSDSAARTVSYSYSQGYLNQVTAIDETNTYYTYNQNNLSNIEDTLHNTYTISYSNNKVWKVIDPLNHETAFSYQAGQTSMTLANNATMTHYLDNIGRQTRIVDHMEAETLFEYDSNNNVTKETDNEGIVTQKEYDPLSRLTSITLDYGGINATTYYIYDGNSNLISVRDAESTGAGHRETTYSYNQQNQVAGFKDVLGNIATYAYDNNANLQSISMPSGRTINFSYDGSNEVNTIVRNDNTTISYSRDAEGNPTYAEVRQNGLLTSHKEYEYYDDESLKQEREGTSSNPDYNINYTYDTDGNTTNLLEKYDSDTLRTITNSDDYQGNLISVIDPNSSVMFLNDVNGNPATQVRVGSSIFANYDSENRPTDISINDDNGANLKRYAYIYDHYGNVLSETGSITNSYTYDKLHRPSTWNDGITTTSYNYDKVGNMLTVANGTTTSYEYRDDNSLWKKDGQQIYYYDADGNMVTNDTWSYSYDAEGRLTQATKSGTTVSYSYDHIGRRIKKVIAREGQPTEAISYKYDGWNVLREMNADETQTLAKYTYDKLGKPLSMTRGGATYYYTYNARGDVTALVDSSGVVTNSYSYNPWGKHLTATEAVENPYRYASYRYDSETGLYYLQDRYYSPDIIRFISRNTNMMKDTPGKPCSSNYYINYDDPFCWNLRDDAIQAVCGIIPIITQCKVTKGSVWGGRVTCRFFRKKTIKCYIKLPNCYQVAY